MCEYGMVGNAMCKESLGFNVKCCQCIRKVFTGYFLFHNGLHCVGGRGCKFFCGGLLCRGFEPPCRRAVFGGLFSVGGGCWSDMYGDRVRGVFDKRVCEFDCGLLNGAVCCGSFLLDADAGLLPLVVCVARLGMWDVWFLGVGMLR